MAPMKRRIAATSRAGRRGAEQHVAVLGVGWDGGENLVERNGVENEVGECDADREAEIADPVDDEGFDGGGVGGWPLVPVADQQIGDQADAFPAEKQLKQIVGGDQHQHGEGE